MRTAIIAALITAAAALVGNLVTAFGPALLSWGQKPLFANSEVYKDLKKENPNLEETLKAQLLQREVYYTYRRTEIVFKRIEGEDVVIEARNITRLRNGTDEPKKYTHKASFNNSVSYEEVTFRPLTGPPVTYSKADILRMPSESATLEKVHALPEILIPAHGTIEVESFFVIRKPKRANEMPFVTGRLINAPMTIRIRSEIPDARFKYDWSSLAFDPRLPSDPQGKGSDVTITIPGPVFSGQGINLSWDAS